MEFGAAIFFTDYVIVAKDYDYHRYDALLSQTGFNVVKDLQTVRVYKVGVKE